MNRNPTFLFLTTRSTKAPDLSIRTNWQYSYKEQSSYPAGHAKKNHQYLGNLRLNKLAPTRPRKPLTEQ